MKLKKTFEYRNVWMGLAILWIVWFHSGIVLPSTILTFIKSIGYGGVDIFLFASGIGCYYSLGNNSDTIEFLKRRFVRIIPIYWCFLIVWVVYKVIFRDMPLVAILGNVFCIQNLTGRGNEFNWYMSVMVLTYLLAPLFYRIINRLSSWKQYITVLILLIALSVPFWQNNIAIIVMTRIPIFFLGMVIAKLAKQECVITKKGWVVTASTALCGVVVLIWCFKKYEAYLWSYGLYWYPFLLIVPGACLIVSFFLEQLQKNLLGRAIVRFFGFFGKFSFEIYLIHVFVLDIFGTHFFATGIFPDRIRYRLFALACVVPGCVFLRLYYKGVMKTVSYIQDKFEKKKER